MDTHYRSPFNESGIGFPTPDNLKRKTVTDQTPSATIEKRLRESWDVADSNSRSGSARNNALSAQSINQATPASAMSDSPEYPQGFSLLGDDLIQLDQRQQDELSLLDWSHGRRRGPSGLLTCVLDRRRREQNARKKKVRFVSDDKLVKVQTFEMDENERQNVYTTGQPASGIDIKKSDSQSERKSMEHAVEENSHKTTVTEESPWYPPLPLTGLPPQLVPRGKDSVEKVVFFARQSGSLATLLHNREDLPDSPEEPPESVVPKSTSPDQLKIISLVRAGMAIGQSLSLVPHGPMSPTALGMQHAVEIQSMPVGPVPGNFGPYSGAAGAPGQAQREPHNTPISAYPPPVMKPPEPAVTSGKSPELTADLIARLLKSHKDSQNAPNAGSTSHVPPIIHSYSSTTSVRPDGNAPQYPQSGQYHYPGHPDQRSPGLDARPPWYPPANPSPMGQGPYSYGGPPPPNMGFNPRPRMNGQAPYTHRPMRPMRPCLYITRPNGCRNGSACTFSHDQNAT